MRLRYRPRGTRPARRIGLVGKGICFDTGGVNLKSHKGMYLMHGDMQGSAVAVGSLLTLSRSQSPLEIDCWLALTENQIGPRAYRPQEIVRAMNGVTIQVVHSDAEGRMVLADTLALAAREKPALLLDYATLTGACVNAITDRYSGAFTNRRDLHEAVQAAGRASGERVWCFPMDADFDRELESPVADVLQCAVEGEGRPHPRCTFPEPLRAAGPARGCTSTSPPASTRAGSRTCRRSSPVSACATPRTCSAMLRSSRKRRIALERAATADDPTTGTCTCGTALTWPRCCPSRRSGSHARS